MIVLELGKRALDLIETKDITAVVLCGGEGSRFGPFEKPLAQFTKAGTTATMVDHVLWTLPENVPRLISANKCQSDYATRGQVVGDEALADARGPLLGVFSAMNVVSSRWILVCPGDMPLLPQGWYQPLLENVADAETSRVLHDGRRLQPLLCLIPTWLAEDLRNYLRDGGMSVQQWHSRVNATEILASVANEDAASGFDNINTQQALERLSDTQR